MPNTIILLGQGCRKEGIASSAITPGHLVAFGGANDLQVHSTAAGNARKAFAVENDLIGNGIDDAYAAGDQVQYNVFRPGDEVYALVADGAPAISKNDALESAGDGTLRKITPGSSATSARIDGIIGYALEAVDNSGGSSAARIRIEVA